MKRLLTLFSILICLAIGSSVSAVSLIGSGIESAVCAFEEQDFRAPATGDYTETDTENDISVAQTRVTWTDMDNDCDGQVVRDYGSAYFVGDFTVRFICQYSNTDAWAMAFLWAIANENGGIEPIGSGGQEDDDYIAFYFYDNNGTDEFKLRICVDGNGDTQTDLWSGGPSPSTPYFVTITRDDDGGANNTGQVKAYICTTAYCTEGVNLQDELSVDAPAGEQNDYRYNYAGATYDNNQDNNETDGYVDTMEIKLCL